MAKPKPLAEAFIGGFPHLGANFSALFYLA
jgi:hypothetical protein